MNTINSFILSKSIFDFHFNAKGGYRKLSTGSNQKGDFKLFRTLEFNADGQIEKETGFQSGWTAGPPGFEPPPPIQYQRSFEYKNKLLQLITEINIESKKLLKEYLFTYDGSKIHTIVKKDSNDKNTFVNTEVIDYNRAGFKIKSTLTMTSDFGTSSQKATEIMRDEENKIIRLTSYNVTDKKGLANLPEMKTIREISYSPTRIIKSMKSRLSEEPIIATADLLEEGSQLIKRIANRGKTSRVVEFFYDEQNMRLIEKREKNKEKILITSYRYG